MKIILTTIVFTFSFLITMAQSGTLDNHFGEQGKVLNPTLNSTCSKIALQNDGKIITAGSGRDEVTGEYGFLIARFNIDGRLDESFGNKGRVILNNLEGNPVVSLSALAIQQNGKILITGRVKNPNTYFDIVIVRLNPDGNFDNSFDDNGIVIKNFRYDDIPEEIGLQTDGKILVTGYRENAQSEFLSWFMIRYLVNGKIDKTFGVNGVVFTELVTSTNLSGIIIQPDHKIILGGSYSSFSHTYILVRYLPSGIVDSSFGEFGIAKLRLPDLEQSYSDLSDIALQPDGKIVATGAAGSFYYKMTVARFESNGSVDSSFGVNGYTILPMERGYSRGQTVTVMPDKKIIVTGIYIDGRNTGFAAAKFNSNGTFDSSFGKYGLAVTGFDVDDAGAETGIIQDDGKIIVAGTAYPENGPPFTQIAMVRLNNSINDNENPRSVKIKRWLHHHGFTWEDKPDNLKYYSIQSSTNGSVFSEITRIVKSSKTSHYFEDASPAMGTSFYRIAAVRVDGSTTYSNIIAIESSNVPINVFPNPVKNVLQVLGLPEIVKTKLSIADVNGNIRMTMVANSNTFSVNIAQLPKGNYVLHIHYGNTSVSRKFLKE